MRAQGVVGYWVHLVPSGVPAALWPLMFVIELFGLFTKPFALTVRLFANMVAGHIVIFFLIALTLFISVYVAPVSVAFALGIFMLELFVALVQGGLIVLYLGDHEGIGRGGQFECFFDSAWHRR